MADCGVAIVALMLLCVGLMFIIDVVVGRSKNTDLTKNDTNLIGQKKVLLVLQAPLYGSAISCVARQPAVSLV